jgi:RNA polymerase sigma-70 factor, ECF subfamily
MLPLPRLSALLRSSAPPVFRSPGPADVVIDRQLARIIDEARAAWPRVNLDVAVFLEHLGARLEPVGELTHLLERVRGPELYLACACARGLPAALAAFQERYGTDLRRSLRRMALASSDVDDLVQDVLARLLTATDRPPRIADYSGFGQFKNWLKVVGARVALNRLARVNREYLGEHDDVAADPLLGAHYPELDRLRELYQGEFSIALAAAFATLSAADRTVLRFHLVDRLSVDEIAPLVGLHRSNVARRLSSARRHLVALTHDRLRHMLGLAEADMASILRMIRSRLDLNLDQILATRGG